MKSRTRWFLRSCKQFIIVTSEQQNKQNVHSSEPHRTNTCPKVTWCVKVLCCHSPVLVYVQVLHQTMQSMWLAASDQVIWQPREVQCRETNQTNQQKKQRKWNRKWLFVCLCVCGRGHISVSANKLSPTPDVSKTIWGPESVGSKNDTFRAPQQIKGADRQVCTFHTLNKNCDVTSCLHVIHQDLDWFPFTWQSLVSVQARLAASSVSSFYAKLR